MEETEEMNIVDKITVGEFNKIAHGKIEVRSAYNGKILCKDFNPRKHEDISLRKITSVWGDVRIINNLGFGNIAKPVLCVYVLGDKEYEEDLIKS